jgi:peptidoglycan hydrolase-like protein with peptidoglycan-binding domain
MVTQMQTNLIRLGYDCGRWGADGDFGDATEAAMKAFQKEHGIEPDGDFGPRTFAAMEKAMAELDKPVEQPRKVKIVGGNCYIRTSPWVAPDNILGVAREGEELPYQGEVSENGWLLVVYRGGNAWVSGKYGKIA